jgi:transcriptional regulator with XRE-family HTH domain
MPPARNLTPNASPLAFFGAELRRYRTQAGLSQEQLADAINYSTSLVGAIELANRTPNRDFAERSDRALNADGNLSRLWPLVHLGSYPTWFRTWIDVEREASTLRTWQPLVIPGLLQTEAYARAVVRRQPGLSADQVEERIAARLARQEILTREEPVLLWVLLDEGVLHRPIGDRADMHEQLAKLVATAALPNITVQVLPMDTGSSCGLAGAFVIASLPGAPDTVYLEAQCEGRISDLPSDVVAVTNRYTAIQADALPARASIDLIEKVMSEKWT